MKNINCTHFDTEEYPGFCATCAGYESLKPFQPAENTPAIKNKKYNKSLLLKDLKNFSTLILDNLLLLLKALLYPIRWLLACCILIPYSILSFIVMLIEVPIVWISEKVKGKKMSYFYLSPVFDRISDTGFKIADKLLGD